MKTSPTVTEIKSLCQQNGVRFTAQRQATFEELRSIGKPISAYDLLSRMEKRLGKRVAPLTIYRALDFLVEQGIVHKITSNHSYALCDRPHIHHESVHLVCTDCGGSEELALGEIGSALDKAAANSGFTPNKHIVELEGRCQACNNQVA